MMAMMTMTAMIMTAMQNHDNDDDNNDNDHKASGRAAGGSDNHVVLVVTRITLIRSIEMFKQRSMVVFCCFSIVFVVFLWFGVAQISPPTVHNKKPA